MNKYKLLRNAKYNKHLADLEASSEFWTRPRLFSKWKKIHPIRWIGQNHSCTILDPFTVSHKQRKHFIGYSGWLLRKQPGYNLYQFYEKFFLLHCTISVQYWGREILKSFSNKYSCLQLELKSQHQPSLDYHWIRTLMLYPPSQYVISCKSQIFRPL